MENNNNIHILLIEDNPGDARLIGEMLAESVGYDFQVKYVNRLEAGLRYLESGGIDVCLVDLDLPDSKGVDTLAAVRTQSARVPVLVLTGLESETIAARAVHDGAQDYLVKGQLTANLLIRAILYSIQRHRLIFELRQYALRLHTSHFRLQTIMEQNADGIIIASEGGNILYVNPAAEAILGKGRDELQNQPIGIPILKSEATEIEIVQPSGEVVITEVRVVEIEWEGDVAYLASVRDITERRRVREILGQAAKEWQSTFDAVEDMIVVLDRDHGIIRANQAVKDRFRDKPIFGAKCHQLFHGSHSCIPHCTAKATFRSAEACHSEIQEETMDGRWFMTSAYPIMDGEGSVDKVVHVMRDITESKRTEAIARRLEAEQLVVEEMKEVADMKSQFIEVMAHELRTPMTVIRSGVGLLLEQALGELNEKQTDFLHVIERNIDRLARFSQDVLSLSKLDSGRINVRVKDVVLYDALKPTLEMLRVKAREEDIKVNYEGLQGDYKVWGDPDALCQVAFNLVNNAIMHCPSETTVTLDARLLENDYVEVRVADDGSGIPEEALGRIFERFYQVGRKSGPGYRGTGIGLAVCKGLVEKMGGKIFVESVAGQGTTFRYLLPTSAVRGETLFGRIAMFLGYVTQSQLSEAIESQQNDDDDDRKLGEILMDEGHLTRVEVDEVLENQEATLAKPHNHLPSAMSEALLGQLARKYEYITEGQLNEVLRDQAVKRESGEHVRIGQVMVEKDIMSPEDIIMVLHMQKQHIVACPSCWNRFNAARTKKGEELKCPQCGNVLVKDESEEIDVDGDVE